jgi:hypothetical protein
MNKLLVALFTLFLSFSILAPASAALGDVTISFVDSNGDPLPYGDLYWTTPNQQFHSSGSFYANNKGEVTIKNMFLGEVSLQGYWINRTNMTVIEGNWNFDSSSKDVTLAVSALPVLKTYKIRVNLPNGNPVPNAVVVLNFFKFNDEEQNDEALYDFARQSLTGHNFSGSYKSICALADEDSDCPESIGMNSRGIHVRTNDKGVSAFVGFEDSVNSPDVSARFYAYYSDDSTYQQTDPVGFEFDGLNVVSLEYMPWFETQDVDLTGKYGTLVPVEVKLSENNNGLLANNDKSGYEVKVTPPKGYKNKFCSGKTKLKATTNSSGVAKFRICAAKSGEYQISSPGVISSRSINVRVIGAPPSKPSVTKFETPTKKTIHLVVKAPIYTGGAKVTKYRVVVSGSEKGGIKQYSKTFNVTYEKATQKIILPGINSYGDSSVKVYAVTKNGIGDFVEVYPTLW